MSVTKWTQKIHDLFMYISQNYGARTGKLIEWAWNNRTTVYEWFAKGATLAWIAAEISRRV